MAPTPPPTLQPLIAWLDQPVFTSPRHPAVAVAAWYEGSNAKWGGSIRYVRMDTGRPSAASRFGSGGYFQWVFRGDIGAAYDSPDMSRLSIGVGINADGSKSLYGGYAEADSMPDDFAKSTLVLLNAKDPVGIVRGVMEVGDGLPKLWLTLGPIYAF